VRAVATSLWAVSATPGRGPLVLLHPFPLDATSWAPVRDALGWPGPVIAPDFPGFGAAEPEPAPTIEGFADRVAGLVPAGPGALVVGVSMGGYAALALTLRHPGRVGALVLACTRAEADDAAARASRERGIAAVRDGGRDAFLDGLLPRLMASDAAPEAVAQARAIAGRQPPQAIAACLAALRDRPDRSRDLGAIGVPAQVVAGAEDAAVPLAASRALAGGLPQGRLAVIEGAGHLALLERPAALAELIRRFAAALPEV